MRQSYRQTSRRWRLSRVARKSDLCGLGTYPSDLHLLHLRNEGMSRPRCRSNQRCTCQSILVGLSTHMALTLLPVKQFILFNVEGNTLIVIPPIFHGSVLEFCVLLIMHCCALESRVKITDFEVSGLVEGVCKCKSWYRGSSQK